MAIASSYFADRYAKRGLAIIIFAILGVAGFAIFIGTLQFFNLWSIVTYSDSRNPPCPRAICFPVPHPPRNVRYGTSPRHLDRKQLSLSVRHPSSLYRTPGRGDEQRWHILHMATWQLEQTARVHRRCVGARNVPSRDCSELRALLVVASAGE